jgi:hypothetical protein
MEYYKNIRMKKQNMPCDYFGDFISDEYLKRLKELLREFH